MMRLQYLVANMVWVFTFGDAIIILNGEPRFYQTRADAVASAKKRGLLVDKKGRVSATPSDQ